MWNHNDIFNVKICGAETDRLQHAALWLHMNHSMIIKLLNLSQTFHIPYAHTFTHIHIHTHTNTDTHKRMLGFGAPNGRLTEMCKVTTAVSTLTPLCSFLSYVYSIKFTHKENNPLFDWKINFLSIEWSKWQFTSTNLQLSWNDIIWNGCKCK